MQEREIPKHRKRRGGKRPFAIEFRNRPDRCRNRMFGDKWRVWNRYKTEASRAEALRALEVGGIGASAIRGENIFEYRKAN